MGGESAAGGARIPREKILAAYRAGPEAIVSLIQYLQDMYEGELRALRAEHEAKLADLAEQIKQLRQRLHTDSRNSTTPPSGDGPARRLYPKRLRSERKPGGQPGHDGMTLKRVAVTEPRAEIKCCPGCGRRVVAEFPADVKHAAQYGPRMCSTVIYLKDYALLPYGRLRQLMGNLFGVRVSAGTLAHIEQDCAERLKETVEQIRREVQAAAVVHFDETGLRIEGKLCWLHSASTTETTYYQVHHRRGTEAIDAMACWEASAGLQCTMGGRGTPVLGSVTRCATPIIFAS